MAEHTGPGSRSGARRRDPVRAAGDTDRRQRLSLLLEYATIGWLAAGVSIMIPVAASQGPVSLPEGYGIISLLGLVASAVVVGTSAEESDRRAGNRWQAVVHVALVLVLLALSVSAGAARTGSVAGLCWILATVPVMTALAVAKSRVADESGCGERLRVSGPTVVQSLAALAAWAGLLDGLWRWAGSLVFVAAACCAADVAVRSARTAA
ncbi:MULTISPECIES: hypothetical protein [unclassified Kitasatospora]|uniref:hypothetical protein n=1 Tax=unclassified Kitasatospora TaxID=2633591 RepID=UPI0033E30A0F